MFVAVLGDVPLREQNGHLARTGVLRTGGDISCLRVASVQEEQAFRGIVRMDGDIYLSPVRFDIYGNETIRYIIVPAVL